MTSALEAPAIHLVEMAYKAIGDGDYKTASNRFWRAAYCFKLCGNVEKEKECRKLYESTFKIHYRAKE